MSSPVGSAKSHGENSSGPDDNVNGNNQQQSPAKRKRLTQACDACRKKKVKCSGKKPCDNCTRLGTVCTYLPSTRKRGPRVGLVESLEKRLQQMERLLQPLKEQGLVDESDGQTFEHTVKKPRLNSAEPYPAGNFSDTEDNQFYSNHNSSELDTQHKGPSKDTKSPSNFHSSPNQFNNPNYTPSEQKHHTFSQSELINYLLQSPQSTISSPQLSTPVENQSPVISQDKFSEGSRDEPVPLIKPDISDEETEIFFGKTAAFPGFRGAGELAKCHEKIQVFEESLQKKSFTDTTSEQITPTTSPYSHVPSGSSLMSSRLIDFPTNDIVEHLTSCFFRSLDDQFPMFHQATFKRQLRQEKVPPFLILSMCAVSARFSDHPMIKTYPPYLSGEGFANLATQRITSAFDAPSVENVQALILLTMHTFGSQKGPRSWMYIGIAIRMAQELGLHKIDEPDPSNTSNQMDSESAFIKKEIKRRTFWACFMLDRFSACALGRPAVIHEEDCDVRLPCVESIWTIDHPFTSPAINEYLKEDYIKRDTHFNLSTSGIYSIFCSVFILLGRASQYANRSKPTSALPTWDPQSEYAILENEIEDWYRKITPYYGYSKERLNTFNSIGYGGLFASLHLLYYAVVVVLNRPNYVKLQNEDYPIIHSNFIEKSAAKCSTAATHVSSMAADIIQHAIHLKCPFTLYPVFATATIHINDSYNEDINIANAAKESLKIHNKYMCDIGPIWAMANKMCQMVKEMCNLQSDTPKAAFFFDGEKRKRRTQPRTELLSPSTDAGLMAFWNRTNSNPPDTNNNLMVTMGFPDQLLSPRWFLNESNDNLMVGDPWVNFLRSQSSVTPGSLIRYTKKENGENEEDYFSQFMSTYNNNSSYVYEPSNFDMQTIPEWLPGRFMHPNRQTIKQWTDADSIIPDSIVQIPLSSSNIDDQGSSREFKTTNSQRVNDIRLDPFIR
ncbi:13409_t:CDS:2 [Acaulospora morrowiae]|uniref:13409_t:CDS:1 n=1 Tax=Acaulospora morrowiae TaxID=94023 RepID=A0A9N9BY09_9GLOM|nr:13409_t:CDS:2 [Acaulospora morrowiae]